MGRRQTLWHRRVAGSSNLRTPLRLCQQVLARAFSSYGQLREPSAARSWLFTILARTHLNRARTSRRRGETVGIDLDDAVFETALAEWAPLPSPAETGETWELGVQLTRALDELPPELSSVVWLVDVEGFAQREVPWVDPPQLPCTCPPCWWVPRSSSACTSALIVASWWAPAKPIQRAAILPLRSSSTVYGKPG